MWPRRLSAMSLKDPVAQWRDWWRSVGVFGPLSGDVTQTIDPTLFRAVGDQVGFINVNTSAAGDPALERRITEQVASYGRCACAWAHSDAGLRAVRLILGLAGRGHAACYAEQWTRQQPSALSDS
jgi:hypothetical protein